MYKNYLDIYKKTCQKHNKTTKTLTKMDINYCFAEYIIIIIIHEFHC